MSFANRTPAAKERGIINERMGYDRRWPVMMKNAGVLRMEEEVQRGQHKGEGERKDPKLIKRPNNPAPYVSCSVAKSRFLKNVECIGWIIISILSDHECISSNIPWRGLPHSRHELLCVWIHVKGIPKYHPTKPG